MGLSWLVMFTLRTLYGIASDVQLVGAVKKKKKKKKKKKNKKKKNVHMSIASLLSYNRV
jgi:hypothetical protein